MMIDVVREEEGDDVLSLYGCVFGAQFPDKKRAVNRLRMGRLPEKDLSFVVRGGKGDLLGSVRCTEVGLGFVGSSFLEPCVMLGPLAVLSELRGEGIGRALVQRVLSEVQGKREVITFGDPGYFVPFGFWTLLRKDVKISGDVRPLSVMVYGKEKRDKIVMIARYGEECDENVI